MSAFVMFIFFFFFFKQKTAYEIPLCDWSSDVCSSDLAGPDGDLDRVLVPAAARTGLRRERENELFARCAEAARRAVEAVEHDALDGRVDPTRAAVSRHARVRQLRRRLAQGSLPELDGDERQAAGEQCGEDPDRRCATSQSVSSRRRKTNARSSARAAKAAQTKKAEREARVIVDSIAPTSRSRAAARAESSC